MSESFNRIECICLSVTVEYFRFTLQFGPEIFTRQFRAENSLRGNEKLLILLGNFIRGNVRSKSK